MMAWAGAVAGQALLLALCVLWRERVWALVAAHTSSSLPDVGQAALATGVAWLALGTAFWGVQPRHLRTGWMHCALWAGLARAAVIPVALVASPLLLAGQLAHAKADLERKFPLVVSSITPAAWILMAVYVVAVIVAVFAHGRAYAKAAGTPHVSVARFALAYVLAAAVAEAVVRVVPGG